MKLRPGIVLRNTTVVLLGILWAIPTYLIIVNAMTPSTAGFSAPVWFPTGFAFFENALIGWNQGGFIGPFFNSLFYAVVGAGVAVIFSALASFGLIVLPVRREKLFFWLIYAGTLLPLQVIAVPLFQASAAMNLYDTKWILLIVYTAVCVPFAFFVTRNFLVTLPIELAQAAKIDGAGWWRMFFSIYLPLLRPAMVAGFVFQFIYIWNELFFGLSLVLSQENQPVMAGLASLQAQGASVQQPAILATAIVVSLPAVLVFLIFQKYFVSGLTNRL